MPDKKIKSFEEMISKQMDSAKKSFLKSQKRLKSELKKYRLDNILTSLFISSIWLPNISSQVKHPFIYLTLVSIDEPDFSQAQEPWDYEKFSSFLEKIYSLVPSFPSVEDYLPEPDWGEIKYCLEDKHYKIFYGNELSNVYEYLTIFELVFCAYDEIFIKNRERSPLGEMKASLRLQDYILGNLKSQFDSVELDISTGHLEVPPESFYKESIEFLSKLIVKSLVSHSFLEIYSCDFGKTRVEEPNWHSFGDMIHSGNFLPYYFIKCDGKYFPVLPRRYTAVLFESWSKVFQDYYGELKIDEDGINAAISAKIYRYFKKRIMTNAIFPVASAVKEDGKPHSLIYDFAFTSKDRLFLVKLLPPSYSSDQIEQCIERNLSAYDESLRLIEKAPVTLALHLDRQNVQFQANEDGKVLSPNLSIIIPQVSTSIFGVKFDKPIPGELMFLDSFLGIVDEIDKVEEFSDFTDYVDVNKKNMGPFISTMDLFGSFKDSAGILIGGALNPTMVSIDPHWGTSKRYNTLRDFWTLFPSTGYFDDPRSWKIEKESSNRVRLIARSYLGFAIYSKKAGKHIFFTSPFEDLTYETGRMANLLMECLEDSLEHRSKIIKEHAFFNQDTYERIDVLFFPASLVSENPKFKHLKHLKINKNDWASDECLIQYNHLGIRFVFNDSKMVNVFASAKDQTIEANLCIEFMERINSFYPDKKFKKIAEKIELTKGGMPRFKMFGLRKEAAFPDLVRICKPEPTDFKKAKKRIAEICKSVGFVEGKYSLENAKIKINKLRSKLINEIDNEVKKYNYESSIGFVLTRIGALLHENFFDRTRIEHAVTHEIDYDPNKRFAEQHESFIREHRNFRYLIEKFVQIKPKGNESLGKAGFQYLAALTDWIITFYSASDSLHYGLHPIRMNVTHDYLVDVELDKKVQEMEDSYGEIIAKIRLGEIGNSDDQLDTGVDAKKFVHKLDQAFLLEQGFRFSNMLNLLQILCQWPYHIDDNTEKTNYSATQDEINKVYGEIVPEINKDEIEAICNFLTLKSSDVLRVTGSDDLCDDLPVWEHRKRFARYMIRPLIKIGDKFIWEPYSAAKSGNVWAGGPVEGFLPTDIGSPEIERIIQLRKNEIENILVAKTEEILKRHTDNVKKNLKLHKIDKDGNHPIKLGDYDVFGYIPAKKSILCIECKDILPAFCMKDSKRIREKIFGRVGKANGYVEPVKKRHNYIIENYDRILNSLGWSYNEPPRVISIFVSRYYYVWTMFPPEEIDIFFTRIDLLSEFVDELNNKKDINSL